MPYVRRHIEFRRNLLKFLAGRLRLPDFRSDFPLFFHRDRCHNKAGGTLVGDSHDHTLALSGFSRRQFLGRSAQQAAGVAAGMVALSGAAAENPSERLRLGLIGLRHQGKSLAESLVAFPDVELAALCDVDPQQFAPVMKLSSEARRPSPRCESDFRRLLDDPSLDAVVIATPDHWHAWMTVLACQAGKDVYLESPATHHLGEHAALLAAAESSQRVIQVGLQQRSGRHFQTAVDLVGSGRLGAVKLARAWIVHRRKSIGRKADAAAPAELDYRQWLGPAPRRAFNPNRFHFNWRWFWEYGGGELAHWGVHWLDVARWGLHVEQPRRVSAVGSKLAFDDDQETPDSLSVQYDFGGPTILWEHRLWSGHGLENRSSGVAFYGERGTLIVDRGGWKVYDSAESLTSEGQELLTPHLRNFIDCVKTRETPAANLPTGLASSALCHWGNAAYRLGREIRPLETSNDSQLQALLDPASRPGWSLPVL